MASGGLTTWSGSLHSTFRLLPQASQNLKPFLESNGRTPTELLADLPYARSRSGESVRDIPDPKRYRDGKQVYQTAGLLHELDGRIRVTDLGRAVYRWLPIINQKNRALLGRHAAYSLAACQLRNPTGAGERYADSMRVFPFSFIWTAMLALGGRISSTELNRGLFKVRDGEDLRRCIDEIARSRATGDTATLGAEVIDAPGKNDRIIPWMALASFGWTLFSDKSESDDSEYYELSPDTRPILAEASQVRHRHRDFGSTMEYVEYISRCSALPKDVR